MMEKDVNYFLEGFKKGKRPQRSADGRLNMVEPKPQNIPEQVPEPEQPKRPWYKRIFNKKLS
jgi:hypothetical protein